jgi:D-amino peptidase
MKKVFISVDIEGMEGVSSTMQTNRKNPDFNVARKRLAEDVNAAIRACLEFGVEEVIVCDSHADAENILIEDLHPEAKLISGMIRSSLQMESFDASFDALIVFGHSGAGMSFNGVIDHTWNGGKIYNIRMNDKLINTEALLNAVVSGHYNVPLIAIIGDQAVADEVAAEIENVETIIVKKGLSRFCAESIHPTKARELIYEGTLNALKNASKIKSLKLVEPIKMEIDYFSSNMAETASLIPGVERTTPRTVEVTSDAETIFKLQNLMVFRLKDSY